MDRGTCSRLVSGSDAWSFALIPTAFVREVLWSWVLCSCRNDALEEVCFKICVCNTVRDILQGEIIDVQFCLLFLKPNKEKIDFLLEVRNYCLKLQGETVFNEVSLSPVKCVTVASNAYVSETEKYFVTSQTLFNFFLGSTNSCI